MKQRINIVCSLKFTKLADVIRYIDNHDGTATVETSQLTTLPIYPGGARMTVSVDHIDGGEQFSTQITARLKEIIPTRCVGILVVEVCNDATYIIGTDDLPVRFQTTYSTTSKNLQISHQNTHFPLLKAV